MAGYSGTPLIRKLGIRPGHRLLLTRAPGSLYDELGPLPDGAWEAEAPWDFVLLFCEDLDALAADFGAARDGLQPAGMLWVAWPKKASKVPTDLDGNVVREFGLGAGLVDVKVCAIDATWSGLKFVRRLADRPG